MASRSHAQGGSPAVRLEWLANEAVTVSKTARKHHQSLAGDNFYGNKLASLRIDAANTFAALSSPSAGDTTALAELIEATFSPTTSSDKRHVAAKELAFALRTQWRQSSTPPGDGRDEASLFPLSYLSRTKRGYLVTIGRQMNSCYARGWYDASAVMMRRLLEVAIIEAFEAKGVADKVKKDGNYVHLTDLINAALAEPALPLSRNSKRALPQLRDVGHMSAHGRFFTADKSDLDRVQPGCRVVVEEFLHHAGLLTD